MSAAVEVITAELAKHNVNAVLWFTGGGCTALEITLPPVKDETSETYIVITDANAQVCHDDEDLQEFLGWQACHYLSQDDVLYGEIASFVHGGPHLWAIDENPKVPLRTKNWRMDAENMATNIVNFIADRA